MQSPRFETQEKASLEVYGQNLHLSALLKNLSETGAFIELSDNHNVTKKGSLLRVTVFLDSLQKERVINAEVIWKNGSSLGLKFLSKKDIVNKMLARSQFASN
ncbi:MAG: PilZ domain-containing protein [Pseudobdellovibrionaceae bacterium]|jgi:hypothetical protein